jgi:ligand-binding sensor domain-containing protein
MPCQRHSLKQSFVIAAMLLFALSISHRLRSQELTADTTSQGVEQSVLELDGQSSFVEIPNAGRVLTNLTEATIEGWFKWNSFGVWSRAFDFGQQGQSFALFNWHTTSDLAVQLYPYDRREPIMLRTPRMLVGHPWRHVALVTGPQGARFYIDGMLVSQSPLTHSFKSLREIGSAYFGRSVWVESKDADFHGLMDEIRIWKRARTEAEIRASMFRDVAGNEPDLVALWNFEQQDGRDSSENGLHGVFKGQARVTRARRPTPNLVLRPTVLVGKVMDESNKPLQGATIRIDQNGRRIGETMADFTGDYLLARHSATDRVDIAVSHGDKGIWQLDVSVPVGERTELNFTLKDAVSASGSISTFEEAVAQVAIAVQLLRLKSTNASANAVAPGDEDLEIMMTVTSDERGRFKFANVRPGSYFLRCQRDGAMEYWDAKRPVQIVAGSTLSNLNFRLPPIKKGTWKNYALRDGLAHSIVNAMIPTSDGSLWLATYGGLSKFDGHEFHNLTKANGLLDNRLWCLTRDAQGGLWIGSGSGVSRFDGTQWRHFTTTNGLAQGEINCALAEPDGTMWFGTGEPRLVESGNGLSRFDGHTWSTFTTTNGLPDNDVLAMYREPTGKIWIATHGGLAIYDGKEFKRLTTADGLVDNGVHAIHRDAQGLFWFGTHGGISCYDGRGFTNYTRFNGLASREVFCIFQEPDGTFWFGGDRGVSRFDGKTFVNYVEQDGLIGNTVTAIHRDADGTLWFCTNNGLSRFDPRSFNSFTIRDGLYHPEVTTMFGTPEGDIWFYKFFNSRGDGMHWDLALGDGVSRCDGTNIFNYRIADGVVGNQLNVIYRDAETNLWFGGYFGLSRFDPKENRFSVVIEVPPAASTASGILAIHRDVDGTMWLGTHSGVLRFAGGEKEDFLAAHRLPRTHCTVIKRTPDGMLWMGTQHGAWRWDGTG